MCAMSAVCVWVCVRVCVVSAVRVCTHHSHCPVPGSLVAQLAVYGWRTCPSHAAVTRILGFIFDYWRN